MKRKIIFFFIVFLSISGFSAPKKIDSRDYKNFISFVDDLNENFQVNVVNKILGTDDSGPYDYSIYKITYEDKEFSKAKNKKHLLVLSGMHGNEIAPVFQVRKIIKDINDKKIIVPKNLKIDFLPVMNPYGFERNYRNCSNFTDPNRDLINFSTKEMQVFQKDFKNKYDFVIDFHEATCDGTFFYAYNLKGKRYIKKLLNFLESKNVSLENQYVDVILRVKNGLLYSAFYAQWYLKLKSRATTGIYFTDRNIPFVFTVETSKRADFQERCEIINMIFQYIISNFP